MERTVDPLAERLRRFEPFPPHHFKHCARVAQLEERILGKDEVTSSILVVGSSYIRKILKYYFFVFKEEKSNGKRKICKN